MCSKLLDVQAGICRASPITAAAMNNYHRLLAGSRTVLDQSVGLSVAFNITASTVAYAGGASINTYCVGALCSKVLNFNIKRLLFSWCIFIGVRFGYGYRHFVTV